jgi:rubredoxin
MIPVRSRCPACLARTVGEEDGLRQCHACGYVWEAGTPFEVEAERVAYLRSIAAKRRADGDHTH